MHLGCVSVPLDDVGTGLAHGQAAVRPHGRLEVAAKDPEKSVVVTGISGCIKALFYLSCFCSGTFFSPPTTA